MAQVCIITSSYPVGPEDGTAAAGLFVRDFALALAEEGVGVTVLTPTRPGSKTPDPGIEVRWFEWPSPGVALVRMALWNPLNWWRILKLLKKGRLALDEMIREGRVVHCLAMWAVPAGLLARWAKWHHGVPYSVWALGSDINVLARLPIMRGLVRRVLADADHRYADGIQLAQEVERICGRPCAFLPSSRRRPDSVEPRRESGSSPRFLYVGRYESVKGVDVLVKAMSLYRRSGGTGSLTLYGGGSMEEKLRTEAAGEGLAGVVTIRGYLSPLEVTAAIAGCDCLVIPSRSESIPLVLTEATQLGRPIIATSVGDMGTLLADYRAGRVVPPGDADALAGALAELEREGGAGYDSGVQAISRFFDLQSTARRWRSEVLGGDWPADISSPVHRT